MKIALTGPTGLYVAAEEGGGIDPRVTPEKVALRANRSIRGEWETFELVILSDTQAALRTANGCYVTAEGGGGSFLRTDATTIGVWETFTVIPSSGLFRTWNGVHMLRVRGGPDPVVDARAVWDGLTVEVIEPPPPVTDRKTLKGAFCIPAASGRVWWPAALAVSEAELERYISETVARHYTFAQVLVSGWPYATDYPHIDPDAGELERVLTRCKQAGLNTVVAFDDTCGPDLSYLEPVLTPNRSLIDWCMGIYEINGVLRDPELVLSVLKQSRALLPDAYLAVHFTPVDEGNESHGHVDWHRAKDEANLQCFFFQTAGWVVGVDDAIARLQDYTRRLGGPEFHGYPTLECGVNDYENVTSLTYRGQLSEAQAVQFGNAMMQAPQQPDGGVYSVPPTGFGDGGTP